MALDLVYQAADLISMKGHESLLAEVDIKSTLVHLEDCHLLGMVW